MIGCLRTRVRKQPIIALYFESELVLKFYNLEVRSHSPLAFVIEVSLASYICMSWFVCVQCQFVLVPWAQWGGVLTGQLCTDV